MKNLMTSVVGAWALNSSGTSKVAEQSERIPNHHAIVKKIRAGDKAGLGYVDFIRFIADKGADVWMTAIADKLKMSPEERGLSIGLGALQQGENQPVAAFLATTAASQDKPKPTPEVMKQLRDDIRDLYIDRSINQVLRIDNKGHIQDIDMREHADYRPSREMAKLLEKAGISTSVLDVKGGAGISVSRNSAYPVVPAHFMHIGVIDNNRNYTIAEYGPNGLQNGPLADEFKAWKAKGVPALDVERKPLLQRVLGALRM